MTQSSNLATFTIRSNLYFKYNLNIILAVFKYASKKCILIYNVLQKQNDRIMSHSLIPNKAALSNYIKQLLRYALYLHIL